ncbi:MAG: ATP synthase subunit I [Bacilli bacterium]
MNVDYYVRRYIRIHSVILLLVTLLILYPKTSTFGIGMLIGIAVNLYNLWLLKRKVVDFTERAISGAKLKGLGMLTRIAAALFGLMLAMKFLDQAGVMGLLFGLLTTLCVIVIDLIFFNHNVHEER